MKHHRIQRGKAREILFASLLLAALSTVEPLAAAGAPTLPESVAVEPSIQATSVTAEAVPHRAPKTIRVTATGYSSTPDQTDDSPFITAANTSVRDGVVAANFLPFGTKIMIPAYAGNKVYTVEDRMHRRFSVDYIDLWFPNRAQANSFGKREVEIVILALK